MNDIGYIDKTFSGSIDEVYIKTASEEQLRNMLPYYVGAVEYHTAEKNPKQVIFFQSGANLINKRLGRLRGPQEAGKGAAE